jgi:putative membrane protein
VIDIKNYKLIIGIISVVIPLVVAFLLFAPNKTEVGISWSSFLPHLNGIINTATSIVLISGYIFIKKGSKEWHKTAMITAFTLGCIFLVSYVIYHSTASSTVFGDIDHDGILSDQETESLGSSRNIYLIILLTHIILATVVVPFVLFALFYALTGRFDRHKKIVKFTFPIWLFVSVSGVIVYLMISQYY